MTESRKREQPANTQHQQAQSGALSPGTEKGIAALLLTASVLFSLYVLWPLMSPGYATGGDDVVHMAYEHEASQIVDEHQKIFGWSYLFGVGAPIFLFRPPLQYAAVAIIHKLLMGKVAIVAIHKLFYVLFLGLYPLSIYYLLRKFQIRPLSSAIAALFAITPISMWGHTLDAYFRLGVAKQLIAIFLFPFALGKLHGVVARREAVLPAAILITLCFLSHPYMPYCLLLLCGVYAFLILTGCGWKPAVITANRLFLLWLLTGLLLAAYLVPFYTSEEIQALDFSSTWRHAFEIVCSTTAKTINHYITGGLFDTTRWGTYGGGEWGWQSNTATGRWPILTALSFLGIAVCIRRCRNFAHSMILTSFIFSFLLFLGPDDLPILEKLPFQSNFQYIHEIFMLDALAVCLAGIGGGALVSGAIRLCTHLTSLAKCPDRIATATATVLALVLPLCLIISPYHDRLVMGRMLVKVRLYDTKDLDQTARSLRYPRNRMFEDMVTAIRDPGVSGRIYASAQGAVSGLELFYFTILPSVVKRTNVICGFFSAEVAGANKTLIEKFRPRMPRYRNLIELLNVRYLLCASPNRHLLAPANEYADLIKENATWSLWRTRGEYGHFQIIATSPLAVAADTLRWREFCNAWLEAYKDAPDPKSFPFFVRATGPGTNQADIEPGTFSGLLVLEDEITPEIQDCIDSFSHAGLPIYAQTSPGGIATRSLPGIDEIDFAVFKSAAVTSGTFEETIEERERHGGTVNLSQPAYILFKTAYYRGWRAYADGNRLANVEISPGFLAARLPAGTHTFEYIYDGPNNHRPAKMVSLIALILAIAAFFIFRARPGLIRDRIPASFRLEFGDIRCMRPQLIMAAYGLVGIVLAYLYIQEGVRMRPIPIRPSQGSHMPTDILADWNYLSETNALYEVQISEDRRFREIVYSRAGIPYNYARKQNGLEPGMKYWWRLRSVIDGRARPWSHHVSFSTRPLRTTETDQTPPWTIAATTQAADDGRIAYSGSSSLPEGTYVHVRLYRTDTRVRVQSTATRVRNSRIKGALVPPKTGWPTNVDFVVHYDILMIDQTYPVTSALGENGERLAQRDLAPNHSLLYGLVAEIDSSHTIAANPALIAPTPNAKWTMSLISRHQPHGPLSIMGATTLPNHTRLKLQAYRRGHKDPFLVTDATVINSRFASQMNLEPDESYRIRVVLSPDRQYQAPSRVFGFNGETFRDGGAEGAALSYGLRYAVNLPGKEVFIRQ